MRIPISALLALAGSLSSQNVLVILADDLGTDGIAAYREGTNPPPTPNIDGLARRGVLFRNAWAYPVCTPTRACMNTGRYGFRTGMGTVGGTLSLAENTLPERLTAAGTHTHAWIGKWHLGGRDASHPNQSGWSHFAGALGGAITDYHSWPRVVNGRTATSTTYATSQNVDDALSWIGGQSKPWVCVVAFNAAHTPFHAPPGNLHTQNLAGKSPRRDQPDYFRAMVQAMDTEIGRMLGSLGATTLAQTTVLFLGDNGTSRAASEPPFQRSHAKGSAFEGGVGVPCIVAGPTVVHPGRESSALVHAVDVHDTVLELVGAARVPFIRSDSVGFARYLSNPTQAPLRTALYVESFARNADPLQTGWVAARNAKYKLIRTLTNGSASDQLYDLSVDAFETNDLMRGALTAEQRAARDALLAHIADVRDVGGSFATLGNSTCAGANGTPSIMGSGRPAVGSNYTVFLSRAAGAQPALLTFGASSTSFAGAPLPFDLRAIGAGPGCQLWTSMDVTVRLTTSAAGTASVSIPIPPGLGILAGSRVHHTWLVADPQAPSNPIGLVTTAGLTATIAR